MQGQIFDIQHFCTQDGPGIRTAVFLQGCPLRCVWCHNPESWRPRRVLAYAENRCVSCGRCTSVCPAGGHTLRAGVHALDRTDCIACGSCVDHCCAQAMTWVGRSASVEAVLEEVLKDRAFFDNSGGGLTVSGGEPLAQPHFAAALLEAAKAQGLHTCVETCGHGRAEDLDRLAASTDLFLYDLKETDDARHKLWTGVSNRTILANLARLAERGSAVRLRLPIVPGYNDRADHFQAIAALVARLPGSVAAEVLPYHPLGNGKADRFGFGPSLDLAAVPEAKAEGWREELRRLGVRLVEDEPAPQEESIR